jgi:hypothetical protein
VVTSIRPLERDFGINYEIDTDEEMEEIGAEDCENISDIEEVYLFYFYNFKESE